MKLILKKLKYQRSITKKYLVQDNNIISNIKKVDKHFYNLCNYIKNTCDYPVYTDTDIKYFKDGESKFDDLLIELKKAKEYIFLEYFIIDKGYVWNTVLEILKEKVYGQTKVIFLK